MMIGDKVERFAVVLQGDRRPHHAKVIANMQNAARLNAGKNAHGVARDFSTSLEMTSQWLQSLLPCFCAELIGQAFPCRGRQECLPYNVAITLKSEHISCGAISLFWGIVLAE